MAQEGGGTALQPILQVVAAVGLMFYLAPAGHPLAQDGTQKRSFFRIPLVQGALGNAGSARHPFH
jgi:hypothetical protein